MSQTRSALSRLAWGYLLLFFFIRLDFWPLHFNTQWLGWPLLAWGMYGLQAEDRDFSLLWPFGAALAVFDLASIPLELFGVSLPAGAWSGWLSLLQTVLCLYVHFGLLTVCARLAALRQPGGMALDVRMRRLRSAYLIFYTLSSRAAQQVLWILPVSRFLQQNEDAAAMLGFAFAAAFAAVAAAIAVSLFRLRSFFPSGAEPPAEPDGLSGT